MRTDADPDGSPARVVLGHGHASGRHMEKREHLYSKFTGPARGTPWFRLDRPMSGSDAAAVHLSDSGLLAERVGRSFFRPRRETADVVGGTVFRIRRGRGVGRRDAGELSCRN